MIGRGVARMVYHSSRVAKVSLPPDTQQLLDVSDEIVWTSTGVENISSSFPNWAIGELNITSGDDGGIESLLRKWELCNIRTSRLPVFLRV